MKISVPLNRITPNPWQTRIAEPGADYIKDLALDIARNGLLQTPVGRLMSGEEQDIRPAMPPNQLENEFFLENDLAMQLAFGHNRLEAYRWLADVKDHSNLEGDWSSMPVEVRDLTDEQMAMLSWSENEKRRDVTPIERARAIQKRLEDFKWTHRQAAEALGIDHSTIGHILSLLRMPENLQMALQAGEMTERQAGAILVLFELPEFVETSWNKKDDIIRSAMNGMPSDHLRTEVDNYLKANGKKLQDADFKLSQLIPEGGAVYCGTCETCDKRYKNRNLCFVYECFAAKTAFVRLQYLKEASFLSGYPILDQEKGGNPTWISDDRLEQIKAAKCPNLVLKYTIEGNDRVPGFPHASLICEKRNDSCSCLAGLAVGAHAHQYFSQNIKVAEEMEGELSTDSALAMGTSGTSGSGLNGLEKAAMEAQPAGLSARDLEEAARQARKDKKEAQERRGEIQKLVEERLVQAMREHLPGVFYLIARQSTFIYGNTRLDLEECYQHIAHSLTSYPLVPSQSDSLAEMIKYINDGLARLELEPISLEKSLIEVFEEAE